MGADVGPAVDAVELDRGEAHVHDAGVTSPTGDTVPFQLTATDSENESEHRSVSICVDAEHTNGGSHQEPAGGTCSNFCIGDVVTLGTTITNPDGTNPPDYT